MRKDRCYQHENLAFRIFQIILRTSLALIFFIGIHVPASQAQALLKDLKANPKLKWSEKMLSELTQGRTTKVIVVLRDVEAENTGLSIDSLLKNRVKEKTWKKQIHERVLRVQNKVINDIKRGKTFIGKKFKYITGFAIEASQKEIESLLSHEDVISIAEDEILRPDLRQGITLIQADAYRETYNGFGVAIAVCDTGIDYFHPDLGNGSFPNNKIIGGFDTGENDNDPYDRAGHGTCCAGIAAGDVNGIGDYIGGVAFNAKIYALKITNSATGILAYSSDIIDAWEWCITHQYDDPENPILIISHSFSGGRYYNQNQCDSEQSSLYIAASNVRSAGISLFVSAGNSGYCDSTSKPGCLSNTVNVGSVYDTSFGTYHPCVSSDSCTEIFQTSGCGSLGYYAEDATEADKVPSYSNSAPFLTLLAPANRAYTTDISGPGGYASGDYRSNFGGTSAACPFAAGAAACLQSASMALSGTYLSPEELEAYLVDNGDPITDKKSSLTTNRINLRKAIKAIELNTTPTISAPTNFGIVK